MLLRPARAFEIARLEAAATGAFWTSA